MRNFRILFSTPFSHFTHFILLPLLCYGAHLVFWSGAVSGRNTRRAEHPAEARRKLGRSSAKAPRKLNSSTVMQLAAGSRSGYPLNFAFTLKQLETYDAQKHRNAWLMMKTDYDGCMNYEWWWRPKSWWSRSTSKYIINHKLIVSYHHLLILIVCLW